MMVMTDAWAEAAIEQLQASIAATGPLDGALLGIFTNNITPTNATVLSDLTEATFVGYARQALVLSVPGRDQNGNIGCFSTRLIWQETTTPVTVQCFGVFLVDSTGLILYGVELFGAPITLNNLLDYIATVSEFLGNNNNQANTTVVE